MSEKTPLLIESPPAKPGISWKVAAGVSAGVAVVVAIILLCYFVIFSNSSTKPNIVVFLADDLDFMLNGPDFLVYTQQRIKERGTTFNWTYSTSPECCPSRGSILTGKYMHNSGVLNNTINGGCLSQSWQDGPEKEGFAPYIDGAGYSTIYIGKYMNTYGSDNPGGDAYIPPGWDSWRAMLDRNYFEGNWSIDGVRMNFGRDVYATDIQRDYALEFLDGVGSKPKDPFLLFVGAIAPHTPDSPVAYQQELSDVIAPRLPAYNKLYTDRHWLTREMGLFGEMDDNGIEYADVYYRRRGLALMGLDDMIVAVMDKLDALGLTDNTYIIFTSDNGFHLGSWGMTFGRSQPYEEDNRVPFWIRGPNIPEGLVVDDNLLSLVDLAPTLLDIAGVAVPSTMDGRSLLPLLNSLAQTNSDVTHRTELLYEYSGEEGSESFCQVDHCNCPPGANWTRPPYVYISPHPCSCMDAPNNTFACMRQMDGSVNSVYCLFDDDEAFREYYDFDADPWQETNSISSVSSELLDWLDGQMDVYSTCVGETCPSAPSGRPT